MQPGNLSASTKLAFTVCFPVSAACCFAATFRLCPAGRWPQFLSGYGASTGRPTLKNLREDGLAAFERFVALTLDAARRYVMGFSLGSAALLDVADRLQPRPSGAIIASGFASAREIAVSEGRVPGWLAWLLPDVWNNEERVSFVEVPLLIVHSRADEVIPFQQA